MINSNLMQNVKFEIFQIEITSSVITTWIIMLAVLMLSWSVRVSLKGKMSTVQMASEAIVHLIHDTIEGILPGKGDLLFPFISTLWIFILLANLIGLIPGLSSPTSDLSVTSALAFIVFLSVHWFGIKVEGIKKYLQHYVRPNPVLIPFHIISEISRTLALAIRLFGNVMSLEIAALLVLMVAGALVPIPILMLHIVEAFIQTYLFGMLALIYIAGGIQSQELRKQKQRSIT